MENINQQMAPEKEAVKEPAQNEEWQWDAGFWEKMEKDLSLVEPETKEEDALYAEKHAYMNEQIPKINSMERGLFLLKQLGNTGKEIILSSKIKEKLTKEFPNKKEEINGEKKFKFF